MTKADLRAARDKSVQAPSSVTPPAAPLSSLGRADWIRALAAAAILSAVALAIYANSFQTSFVFDGTTRLQEALSADKPWWDAIRPLGLISFRLNCVLNERLGLHRFDVRSFHAVNLLVHVAAALTLFGIVRRALASGRLAGRYSGAAWGLALAVALLWMAHPLQTQSVTYIYQRFEAQMALFYLLTLYAFIRAQDSRHPVPWHVAGVLCALLAIGTKEVALTAPLAVLWYDRAFVAGSWRQIARRRWAFYLGLALVWVVLAWQILPNLKTYQESGELVADQITPVQYALSQSGVILHYLRLVVWPTQLCLDYGWPVAHTAMEIVPQTLAILVLLVLTLWCMLRVPTLGFVAGSFFLVLGPTSSIAPICDLAFEHRMYLPLASVVTLVVLGGYVAAQGLFSRLAGSGEHLRLTQWLVGGTILLVIVAALGYLTVQRNKDYRTEFSIWDDTVQKAPRNPRARANRGLEYSKMGQLDRALEDANGAIELRPNLPEAYVIRGLAHEKMGPLDKALEDWNEAIELRPNDSKVYLNRGFVYAKMGQLDKALEDWNRAIELRPNYPEAYLNRGAAYAQTNRSDLALKDFDRAIGLQPGNTQFYFARSQAYMALGRYFEAWGDLRTIRRLGGQPDPAFIKALQDASGQSE